MTATKLYGRKKAYSGEKGRDWSDCPLKTKPAPPLLATISILPGGQANNPAGIRQPQKPPPPPKHTKPLPSTHGRVCRRHPVAGGAERVVVRLGEADAVWDRAPGGAGDGASLPGPPMAPVHLRTPDPSPPSPPSSPPLLAALGAGGEAVVAAPPPPPPRHRSPQTPAAETRRTDTLPGPNSGAGLRAGDRTDPPGPAGKPWRETRAGGPSLAGPGWRRGRRRRPSKALTMGEFHVVLKAQKIQNLTGSWMVHPCTNHSAVCCAHWTKQHNKDSASDQMDRSKNTG